MAGKKKGAGSKQALQMIAVLALVVCAAAALLMFMSFKKNRSATDKAAEIAAESADIIEDKLMDFDALHEINEDIYAYIQIPGTAVDYPIVQHADDTTGNWYYLRRGLDGEKLTAGCLFTEPRNAKDFSDPDTVIYGHNMRDGSMFADLHKYEDDMFMEESPYVYIYTPEKNYIYRIFAAYHYDDRLILDYFDDFKDINNFKFYIDEMFEKYAINGVVDEDVEVTLDDKLLTLSTCSWSDEDARYLVQAVQLTDDEKQELLHEQRDGGSADAEKAVDDTTENGADSDSEDTEE